MSQRGGELLDGHPGLSDYRTQRACWDVAISVYRNKNQGIAARLTQVVVTSSDTQKQVTFPLE